MPAAITHRIFAQKVLEDVRLNLSIQLDEPSFFYGAQGPDIFFTHRFMTWQKGESLKKYGEMLHNTQAKILLSIMRKYVAENNSIIIASYFFGFICHYCLDSVCHPYIKYISKEQLEDEPEQTEGILHCESEAALDAIVYRHEYEDLASKVNIGEYFKIDDEVKAEVSKMYSYIIEELYKEEVSEFKMNEIIDDAFNVYSWLFDKYGLKKFLLRIIEGAGARKLSNHFVPDMENSEFDYGNFSETIWIDLNGNERNESFFALMDMAIKKATIIIGGLGTSSDEEICDNEPF